MLDVALGHFGTWITTCTICRVTRVIKHAGRRIGTFRYLDHYLYYMSRNQSHEACWTSHWDISVPGSLAVLYVVQPESLSKLDVALGHFGTWITTCTICRVRKKIKNKKF